MGFHFDLAPGVPAIHRIRRAPGRVRHLTARVEPRGDHVLFWQPPAGTTWVDGYRIERTRQGRDYEWLGETETERFTVTAPPAGEAWFYRVAAFNERGTGAFRMVFLYRRPMRLRPRGPVLPWMLFPVPAIPGRRMEILECEPEMPRTARF